MVKMTYSLYQHQFEILAEVLALREIGLTQQSNQKLIRALKKDRGDFFDAKEFWQKVAEKKKEYQLLGLGESEE